MLVAAGQELHRVACDSGSKLVAFFNSDTLYPAAFYQDVVIDGHSWKGFEFSSATDWYPDFLIYFSARAITGQTSQAMVVCSGVLFVLLLSGFVALSRTLTLPGERGKQTFLIMMLGVLMLLVNARSGFMNARFHFPLIFTYHSGSLICMVFGLAMVLALLRAPEWQRRHHGLLLMLFVNTWLCMASDRLLLMEFVCPAIGSVVAMRLFGLTTTKRLLAIAAVLTLSSLAGQQLLRLSQPAYKDLQIGSLPFSVENAVTGGKMLPRKWWEHVLMGEGLHLLATMWMAMCFAHATIAGCQLLRGRPLPQSPAGRGMLFLSIGYLLLVLSSLVAISYSGVFYNPPTLLDIEMGRLPQVHATHLFHAVLSRRNLAALDARSLAQSIDESSLHRLGGPGGHDVLRIAADPFG